MPRYAIYYTPRGALGDAGAAWLGWDIARHARTVQPSLEGVDIAAITERPRRYGFHATIKPPFVLAPGQSLEELEKAFAQLCATLAPVQLPVLEPTWMGGFLALTTRGGDPEALTELAATCVANLDIFRAPLTAEERAKRDHPRLSASARRNLDAWGYPHVMADFRFHLTLTGRIPRNQRAAVESAAAERVALHVPSPCEIDRLTLVEEGEDGHFRETLRVPLQG